MELQNKFGIIGRVRLECYDKDGNLKWDTGFMKNTITNAGLGVVSGLVGNVDSQTAFTYLAVGTSSTAESAAHTALQAEITTGGLERAAATVSRETTNQTNDTLQLTYTWTSSASHTVEETGAFNDASAGTMLGRKLTGSKSVVNTDQLVGTYQFIFAGA